MESEISIINKYFPKLSDLQRKRFMDLKDLYESWNSMINLISRKDIDQLYVKHILHSLAIAKFIDLKPGSNILDLGTGGGFPGIPLAIYFEKVNFMLIDGTAKKIKAVNGIIESLGLTNVVAQQKRAEELKGKFDFVVNRAVAESQKLYQWSTRLISSSHRNAAPNGIISLKGGDLKGELSQLPKNTFTEEILISDYFDEPFFESKKLVYIQM